MIKFDKVTNIPSSSSEEGIYFVYKSINHKDNGIYVVSVFTIPGGQPVKSIVRLSNSTNKLEVETSSINYKILNDNTDIIISSKNGTFELPAASNNKGKRIILKNIQYINTPYREYTLGRFIFGNPYRIETAIYGAPSINTFCQVGNKIKFNNFIATITNMSSNVIDINNVKPVSIDYGDTLTITLLKSIRTLNNELIDNKSFIDISQPLLDHNDAIELISDGYNWFILNHYNRNTSHFINGFMQMYKVQTDNKGDILLENGLLKLNDGDLIINDL